MPQTKPPQKRLCFRKLLFKMRRILLNVAKAAVSVSHQRVICVLMHSLEHSAVNLCLLIALIYINLTRILCVELVNQILHTWIIVHNHLGVLRFSVIQPNRVKRIEQLLDVPCPLCFLHSQVREVLRVQVVNPIITEVFAQILQIP